MRVLQLIDSLNAGGAERMAVNIANAISKSIDTSYLCTTRKEGLLKSSVKPSVNYLFLNRKSTLDIQAIIKLHKFIKKEKIDIIHSHSTSFFLATLMKLMNTKLKIVWHDHYGNSNFLNQRPIKVLKWASKQFSHIYSVNNKLEKWAKLNLKSKSVSYLSNFVTQEKLNLSVTQLFGQEGKRILCLANLRPQKDHINLLKAFNIVNKQHKNWTLHCVGQDFGDEYAKEVYAIVDRLKLKKAIFFYGSKPDSMAIINQCDIGVLASKSEGLPLALLEYGMGKLAVVATNVGDCVKVITSEKSGILVNPNDEVALANALNTYIINEEQRALVAGQLHNTIVENFSENAIINTVLKQYDAILH